jgi:transient receptor potential cation channel subfamily M protein 6
MDIDKELFLWSVLTGKQELALLFWARGKNKVCKYSKFIRRLLVIFWIEGAALIATLLNKRKARKEKDLRYNEWADQFENLAVEILEKFYRTHPSECTKAIIREIPQFGNVTWLHLAVMAEAKYFIAQRAVQNVLSSIWYNLKYS